MPSKIYLGLGGGGSMPSPTLFYWQYCKEKINN
jgi:hypothetical protein